MAVERSPGRRGRHAYQVTLDTLAIAREVANGPVAEPPESWQAGRTLHIAANDGIGIVSDRALKGTEPVTLDMTRLPRTARGIVVVGKSASDASAAAASRRNSVSRFLALEGLAGKVSTLAVGITLDDGREAVLMFYFRPGPKDKPKAKAADKTTESKKTTRKSARK